VSVSVERLRNLHDGQEAIPAIVSQGPAAIPSLEALLREPSQALPHTRCWAADALAAIGGPLAIQALTRALQDLSKRRLAPVPHEAEGVIIHCVAEHLSSSTDPAIATTLLQALRDRPNSGCIRALGRLGEPRAIPEFVRCLADDAVRGAAIDALRRLGSRSAFPLAQMLSQSVASESLSPSQLDGCVAAAELLGDWVGRHTIACDAAEVLSRNVLVECPADGRRRVRVAAAIALSHGTSDQIARVFRVLIDALDEPDWRLAERTSQAISRFGLICQNGLMSVATDPRAGQAGRVRRLRAVSLLGSLDVSSTVPVLLDLLHDQDREIRVAAVRALGRNSHCDCTLIVPCLCDPHVRVRRKAFEVLRRREALSVDAELRLLGDSDPALRCWAADALQARGDTAQIALRRAVCTLGRPLRGWRPRVRLWRRACRLLLWRSRALHALASTHRVS
jgi:HEAT repeat protein